MVKDIEKNWKFKNCLTEEFKNDMKIVINKEEEIKKIINFIKENPLRELKKEKENKENTVSVSKRINPFK